MRVGSAKIAPMASSSKRRAASTAKQTSAAKTRRISIGRTETLPRKATATADLPLESPDAVVAAPKPKTPRARTAKTAGARAKTPRSAGRTSKKQKAAVEELAPVQPEIEVDASAILEEALEDAVEQATIVEAPLPPPVEASAPATQVSAPVAVSAPRAEKRSLVTAVSRLLSILSRWTGIRS